MEPLGSPAAVPPLQPDLELLYVDESSIVDDLKLIWVGLKRLTWWTWVLNPRWMWRS